MSWAALSCALLLLGGRAAAAAGSSSGDAGAHGQLLVVPAAAEEHRGLQKVRALQRLRKAEWDARMQPLASLLEAYAARHRACEAGAGMPGGVILVRMPDAAAGIGNQIPGVITGLAAALLPAVEPQCMQSAVLQAACASVHRLGPLQVGVRKLQKSRVGPKWIWAAPLERAGCCVRAARLPAGAADGALPVCGLPLLQPLLRTRAGLRLGGAQGAPACRGPRPGRAVHRDRLFTHAPSSLGVHGIILARWSSSSRYTNLSNAAQVVSHAVSIGLIALCCCECCCVRVNSLGCNGVTERGAGYGYAVMGDVWMGRDLRQHISGWPCALLNRDDDYGAALLPSNPHHQARARPPSASSSPSTALNLFC